MQEKNIKLKIAAFLRSIGRKKCIVTAELLTDSKDKNSSLYLRNLNLQIGEVIHIAMFLEEIRKDESGTLDAISFSYNRALKDEGAKVIIKSLPDSIRELGFVDCGISDEGGIELLNWMRKAPNLCMVCAEQNLFSEGLIDAFKEFSLKYPKILLIV